MLRYLKLPNTKLFTQHIPLFLSLIIFGISLLVLVNRAKENADGHFCYPLDDTFIHLSVAKHLVSDGVWGITSEEYGAASSSPLYTIILAIFIWLGFPQLLLPFWLNVVFSFALLFLADHYLRKNGLKPVPVFCTLQGMIWLIPLPVITLLGMEHVLHTLFVLILLQGAVGLIQVPVDWKRTSYVGIIAALALLTRLESLFVIAGIGLLFTLKKRFKQAVWLSVVALLPLLVLGLWSIKSGGHFLPNSILIKGVVDKEGSLIHSLLAGKLPASVHFISFQAPFRLMISGIIVLVLIKLLTIRHYNSSIPGQLMFMWFVTCALHLLFARIGWLYRYEAWLIGIGIFVLGMGSGLEYQWKIMFLRRHQLLPALGILLIVSTISLPLVLRAKESSDNVSLACKNIYEQQFQMARFLAQYYHHVPIAANDVGAISYYGDNNIIDLWGLGNNEVATSKLKGRYTVDFLEGLAVEKDVSIAVIYDSWFAKDLRKKWIKVGSWQIFNNVICGDDRVSFYATEPSSVLLLQKNLKNFESSLPNEVAVFYY